MTQSISITPSLLKKILDYDKEFLGVTEMAELLGLSRVAIWRCKTIPKPSVVLRRGRIWKAEQIKVWAKHKAAAYCIEKGIEDDS